MSKKVISFMLVLSLLGASLLLGSTVLAAEKITLRFPTWCQAPFHRATLTPHIMRFNKTHPNIYVDIQYMSYGEIKEMVQRAGIIDELPAEVLQAETTFAVPLWDLGFVEPLNDFLEDEDNKYLYEQTTEDIWDAWTYKGNIVGWAYNTHGTWLAYSQSLLEEIGVNPKTDITTWDDFLKAAQKLTADTNGDGNIDRWGFIAPANDPMAAYRDHSADFVLGNGAEYLYEENGKWYSSLADDKVIQAMQFISDLRHKYEVTPPDMMGYDWRGLMKTLGDRKAGFIQQIAALGAFFGKESWFEGVEWQYDLAGIVVPAGPQGTKPVASYAAGGWLINKRRSEEVKDAGKELMRHMIHEAYKGALMGNRPVYKWGLEVYRLMGPLFMDCEEIISTYGVHVNHNVPEAISIEDAIGRRVQDIIGEEQDVRQVFEKLDKEITDMLKKAGRQ